MKGEIQKCAYSGCGQKFTAGSNNQKYCSLVCGARARARQEIQGKKPEDAEWEQLTPSQRWELMTWDELNAELARLRLSYGQAQVEGLP